MNEVGKEVMVTTYGLNSLLRNLWCQEVHIASLNTYYVLHSAFDLSFLPSLCPPTSSLPSSLFPSLPSSIPSIFSKPLQ